MRGLFISTAIWFVRLVGKLVSYFLAGESLVPSSDSARVIIKIVNGLKKKKRHVGQFSLLVFINVKGRFFSLTSLGFKAQLNRTPF